MSDVLPWETTKRAIEHSQDNPTSTSLPPPSPFQSSLQTPSTRQLVRTQAFPSGSQPSTMSLALPWEVIERVIEHSWRHPPTLYSFSLTCRQLHPRSITVLFTHVRLENMRQFCGFRDMVQDNVDLRPLVLSLTVNPKFCDPSSLLRDLPNISTLVFHSPWSRLVTFHPTTLMRCKQFGGNIHSMGIEDMTLSTPSEFCRLLLAFPNMSNLACKSFHIEWEGNDVHLDLLRQRLSKQLRLTTLEIGNRIDDTALSLLSELGRSMVEELRIDNYEATLDLSQWTHLRSLMLWLQAWMDIKGEIRRCIDILDTLKPLSSTVVALEFACHCKVDRLYWKLSDSKGLVPKLDQTLLRFSKVNLAFSGLEPLKVRKDHSWAKHLLKFFPNLCKNQPQSFAFTSSGQIGHDNAVTALAVSPDGRWVATSSSDWTIILWDSNGAGIIREWITESDEAYHLAFSPNSQYLASTDDYKGIIIWDPTQSSRQVATLDIGGVSRPYFVWSADGDLIAAHAWRSPVRFWDVRHGFKNVREVDGAPGGPRAEYLWGMSSDFRWLLFSDRSGVCLWDVSAGEAKKTIRGFYGGEMAAFNPTSTLLAATLPDYTAVTVWDLATGDELFVLWEHKYIIGKLVFSPDGQLLLSISRRNNTAKVWDMRRGTMLLSLEGLSEGLSDVYATCFSPCGKYVASRSNKTVKLWRVSDGACLATFSEHNSWVTRVAFSVDGSMLWSGADDGTVFSRCIRDVITK